ncbi:MAG: DegT/DnrJ/EryC1/StrS aminotransferase family protein [Candidatus Sulfotelmatobacter sp.]
MTTTAVRRTLVSAGACPSAPFPSWPHFEPEEIEAAASVLKSGKVNYWTGQEGRLFEDEFAQSVGVKHAICLANGTVALEAALQALGIESGDEIITTSRTFIASASCSVMRGAQPICVDVDPNSQNMTAETIRRAITPRTKAIIAVHLAGWPCDMDPILDLASKLNLYVIEDCAQAQGAAYKGRSVGSIGHAAAFSFCQDKIMTTGGEGGMLVTNNSDLWRRAWSFKDHGKNYDSVYQPNPKPGFRWLHDSFGTNWRMTEMQAAMGRIILRKIPAWVETRRQHAALLSSRLAGIPGLRIPQPPSHSYHSYYKYYVFVRPEMLLSSWSRDRIAQEINDTGVPCFVGSCSEIYLEKAFASGHEHARLPIAKQLGETSLMFLVHPTLSEQHIVSTCDVIERVFARAARD